MKKTKTILCVAFFYLLSLCSLQAKVPSEITEAFGDGSANVITAYFSSNVELEIDNRSDTFSNQQANGIISNFFSKNSPTNFSVIHEGEKDVTSFVIGTLRTNNGAFRVYILTRVENNKDIIQQIRISPSE